MPPMLYDDLLAYPATPEGRKVLSSIGSDLGTLCAGVRAAPRFVLERPAAHMLFGDRR